MFSKKLKIAFLAVAAVVVALQVIRCGGGGGGDSPAARVLEPISYTGVTTPAAISLANTPTLVFNVLYGGASASEMPSAVTITAPSTSPDDSAISSNRLTTILQSSLVDIFGGATQGFAIPTAVVYDNKRVDCESGYYILNGSVDDMTLLGTLTYDYYSCLLDDGVTRDGMKHVTVHRLDNDRFSYTVDYVLMTLTGSELNVTMSGTEQGDIFNPFDPETIRVTMNYVERANNTSKMYKYENFTVTVVYQDSGGTIGFSGVPAAIMYDSDHGSCSVDTPTALQYSSDYIPHPDLGGQLVLTGDQSGIQLTVESARHVKLELDLDGAADEVIRYVLWSELENIATLDLTDTDGDGMHDSWEVTYGLDPNDADDADEDPDSDGLTNLQEYEQGYNPIDEFSSAA